MADVLCPVLVGRDAERAVLQSAFDGAAAGRGGVALVTGAAGLGKSRLARDVAAAAAAVGVPVVVGRCVPAGSASPYRPITEALLQVLRDRPVPDDADLAPWLPLLAAVVPGLGAGDPIEATPAARGEAVVRLLRRIAAGRALMVVLEDLHWADPDTLAVVEYLADNLATVPVLCLVTLRDEPPSPALVLAHRLHDRRSAPLVALERLDDTEVAEMVRACAPEASHDVVRRVQQTADGVPFLVEEILASPGEPSTFA